MTKEKKLAELAAYWGPLIQTRQEARDAAQVDLIDKQNKLDERLTKYQNKINKVNEYYDAQIKIAELQLLQEPSVNGD